MKKNNIKEPNEKLDSDFDIEKKSNMLKQLALAVGLFDIGKNKIINITLKPSTILRKDFESLKNLQPKLNMVYYNLFKDLEAYKFDEPMYNLLYEIYSAKKLVKKDSIVALYIRSDYLLDNKQYKQVEINTISQCFLSFGPLLNKIHSLLYKNVEISNSDKKFLNFIINIKNFYEEKNKVKNTIIVMVDENTDIKSSNYLEKVQLIHLFLQNGVTLRYVTINDLKTVKQNNKKKLSDVFYKDEMVSVIYYRWYYNFNHFNEITKKLRMQLELANVVNLPSIEFQMINNKIFQVVLADKLKLYTKEYKEISSFFGDFISNKDNFEARKLELGFQQNDWLEKSITEGGDSINKRSENSIFMKKFNSATVKNRFLDDKTDRNMINEISIFGCLLIVDEKVIINEESGYIVRSKDENNLEGGICSGNWGLDSLSLID